MICGVEIRLCARRAFPRRWAAAAANGTCGGDQAALESALAYAAYAGRGRACALPLALFPNGMALRQLYGAPAPDAGAPFAVPPSVVAFHANYVVGAATKRAWLESLGLWFV